MLHEYESTTNIRGSWLDTMIYGEMSAGLEINFRNTAYILILK